MASKASAVASADANFNQQQSVQERTVILSLTLHRFGDRVQLGDGEYEAQDAAKKRTSAHKRLLQSEELDRIISLQGAARRSVQRFAVTCSAVRYGRYVVPIGLVDKVEETIDEYRRALDGAVNALIEAYPRIIENDKVELGALFDPKDYPGDDALRQSFGIESDWEATSVPVALKQIKKSLFERERTKAQRKWSEASDEIRTALRAGFVDLVSRLGERLTPSPDGKRTVLKGSLVEGLQEFLALFDAKNLSDDRELKRLVDQARALVDGVSPDDLRKSDDVRSEIRDGLRSITNAATELVEVRSRKIRL